jgi:hypothetical protein
MPGSNSGTRVRFCNGFGSNIVVQHSVGHIVTLHERISAREYVDRLGNQVHPMIQTLFPTLMQFSKTVMAPFTQMELFEEPDGELQHLPRPVQSFENY